MNESHITLKKNNNKQHNPQSVKKVLNPNIIINNHGTIRIKETVQGHER